MKATRASILVVAALALTLAFLPGLVAAQQSPSDDIPVFHGRKVAGVMSYRGAPWLERADRAREENTAALLAKMNLQPGQNVADIGCGSGYFTRRMAATVGPDGYVFAVDIQPEMLEILKRNVKELGLENVVPVLGQEGNPFLPEGEIDWILLVDVYHELQQPAEMLAHMHDALAPEGRVALAEFRLHGPSAAHIKLDHRMSIEQVLAEWEPAGFELAEEVWEELPTQHLFIFKKKSRAK
jgi:ubiquinone/menaquinone biosynthesis C-methylase UbiE